MPLLQPLLPQQDLANATQRQSYLAQQQQAYEFTYEYLQDVALLKRVPREESFSIRYLAERTLATAELPGNMLAAKARSFFDPFDTIEDYADLFTLLPKPEVVKTYQNDHVFSEQRLSGVNPMVIRRIKPGEPMPSTFKGDLDQIQKDFGSSLDLHQELNKGNFYYTDYTEVLGNVNGGAFEQGKKYLPKPFALFCWSGKGFGKWGELIPIAIVLEGVAQTIATLEAAQIPAIPVEPITKVSTFTPFDDHMDWFLAKTCVQIADANHHEMITHLARTHFVMEGVAVATARQLAANHPLGLLLRPHFRFMLFNNNLARNQLINQGGPVDRLLAGTLKESLELARTACLNWRMDKAALPKEIALRGMDDLEATPHYPYRDDGILIWQAICDYVTAYLKLYYTTDQDLVADVELQAWAQELVNGARIQGCPDAFLTLDPLVEVVTTIIFTCGPQHSAINFAQYEYMAFPPNMPLASYQPTPQKSDKKDFSQDQKDKQSLTELRRLQFLPPPKRAADQLDSIFTLAAYRYDQFGYYDEEDFADPDIIDFADPAAQSILIAFRQKLSYVEAKIDNNNRSRVIPYPYLKPSLIINSISI